METSVYSYIFILPSTTIGLFGGLGQTDDELGADAEFALCGNHALVVVEKFLVPLYFIFYIWYYLKPIAL